MRVLVTGATGFIGSHLIEALIANNHDVSAVARNFATLAARFPAVKFIRMDLTTPPRPEEWQQHLRDIDVVINTVGIIAESGSQTFNALHIEFPRALFKACESAGVKRIIHISALGAERDATSRYHLTKYTSEQELRSLDVESVIVKPSLVFGVRGKSTEFFRAAAAQPVQVLIDKGDQQVQPIYIDDLIAILLRLVSMDNPPPEVTAVGPAPITFREMLAGYRHWLGYDPQNSGKLRSISLPFPVAMIFAKLLGFLHSPFFNQENLRMLRHGNTGDPATSTRLLDRPPAAFRHALLEATATDADRWHARLYFLVPLLRWLIAFVWIYTGIISAFVYPVADSYAMLSEVGLRGWMLPVNLYGAALLDIILGVAVLLRYRVFLTGLVQLAVILGYTVIISIFLPEYWIHPFGPIIKNFPFVMLILISMAVERK